METQKLKVDLKTASIGEMVADDYRKAEVFKKFGIDFCCGGKQSLDDTCSKKGINANEVWHALNELGEPNQPHPTHDFNKWALDKLVDYILDTHHKYVKETIPQLDMYSAKVASVHGENHPEVIKIAKYYDSVANELRMHMYKEEAILFPYIVQMAEANRTGAHFSAPGFGTISNPINMMEAEHEVVGETMRDIAELSNNYTPPAEACNTYRVLYAKLQEFENDLHQHIHLENNILFPAAIQLEQQLIS